MHRNRPGFKGNSRLHREVWERDEGKCQYCGYPAQCIDHVEPYVYRHNNHISNLVLACNRCNAIAWANYFDNFEAKRDWILQRRRPEIVRQLRAWELNGLLEVSEGGSGELGTPSVQLIDGAARLAACAADETAAVPADWFTLPRWRTAHQVEQIGVRGHIRLWSTVCGRAYQREDPVVDDSPVRAPEGMKRCGQCDDEVEAVAVGRAAVEALRDGPAAEPKTSARPACPCHRCSPPVGSCVRCGLRDAEDEHGLCGPCDRHVEADVMAARALRDGSGE